MLADSDFSIVSCQRVTTKSVTADVQAPPRLLLQLVSSEVLQLDRTDLGLEQIYICKHKCTGFCEGEAVYLCGFLRLFVSPVPDSSDRFKTLKRVSILPYIWPYLNPLDNSHYWMAEQCSA